ncbi:MAG: nitrogenase [Clostridium sp.]|jgi:nitrogenase molybdenum-iron protein alpha chain|uniref:nitrogenase component 1 n=1 Tax=Clostridium sp. TaxID=1506 RepID=UPI0025BCA0BD|nr:nitrogenase component 1 [Clostridium sp.]MCH3963705.1 nitrogenase [Clostridium sp.]MCI1714846.1 nitrogenase [Clostridium sp.]MCI1798965.1 nitrogenase [Clostridium sp.]MCI1813029.1 nitrogenase [Clostridium sp.]MCI1869919.1 nitrogenase [Clostridium sp.]
MSINLKNSLAPSRESRLGAITGYVGNLNDLVSRSQNGTLNNRERCFSQSSSCNAGCALGQLSGIRDIAVINHAPSGCTAMAANINVTNSQMAAKRGIVNNTVFVGTDMNERDTVFGAAGSLGDIIREVYERYKPKAIFVGTSCASGIIGEDVDSVIEKSREEIPVPIAAVHCEGFRSRVWASGFDASDHAVLTSIVKPPLQKRNIINFKNFYESARNEITDIFANFGVKPVFLYQNSTVEELEHLSESLATVCICGTLGTYLGNGLEEKYGVPYIRTINPLGVTGFETWLRQIGKVIKKESEVENYIEGERKKYIPKIEKVKEELKGLRAVLGMGPGYTFEVARVLQELGIEVVWAASWHYDRKHDNNNLPPAASYLYKNSPDNIKLSVTEQQNYEVLNILNEYKPDIYFSRHPGTTVWAIKQGVPALCVNDEYMIFGYRGTLNFAYSVLDTIKNRSFEKNLASRVKLPYTDWWYKQKNSAFFKKYKAEKEKVK